MLSVYNQTLEPIFSQINLGTLGSALSEHIPLRLQSEDKSPRVKSTAGIALMVSYITLLVAAYTFHVYMMIEPLHLWGQGNIYYISTSVFLVSQTVISILLLLENYIYVFLPNWMRTGEFVLSIFSVIYWTA